MKFLLSCDSTFLWVTRFDNHRKSAIFVVYFGGVLSRFQIDFDDADEEEADELQDEEEHREEGETDVEINVTDKIESTEERAEEPRVQVAREEIENDVTPETEVEPIEADKKDEKEQADVAMKEDERAEENSAIDEIRNTEVTEIPEEGEGTKVSGFFLFEFRKVIGLRDWLKKLAPLFQDQNRL